MLNLQEQQSEREKKKKKTQVEQHLAQDGRRIFISICCQKQQVCN